MLGHKKVYSTLPKLISDLITLNKDINVNSKTRNSLNIKIETHKTESEQKNINFQVESFWNNIPQPKKLNLIKTYSKNQYWIYL